MISVQARKLLQILQRGYLRAAVGVLENARKKRDT